MIDVIVETVSTRSRVEILNALNLPDPAHDETGIDREDLLDVLKRHHERTGDWKKERLTKNLIGAGKDRRSAGATREFWDSYGHQTIAHLSGKGLTNKQKTKAYNKVFNKRVFPQYKKSRRGSGGQKSPQFRPGSEW